MSLVLNPYILGGFDPLTSISWYEAHWAGDPLWSNPGDGSLVSSWRDGSGNARDASSSGASRPTYRATGGPNSQPAVDFGTSGTYMTGPSSTLSQTFSMVAVANFGVVDGTNRYILSAPGAGVLLGYYNPGAGKVWRFHAGSSLTTAAANTSSHLFVAVFNNASSKGYVDATSWSGTAGSNSLSQLELSGFGPGFNTCNGKIAFAATYSGDVTANSQWAAFKSWISSTYGITA